ncbi:MAG: ImmA/IrrE family metallo-endopeptidase [Desulfovibrionaceae bacterium]|nr:ImmA/IrrE family metallo-endopeptidase [Desulfovibrionaceae bacterium]
MLQSKTYIAVPPGETIKEQLSIREMPEEKFSEEMEISPQDTKKLLNGSLSITSDLAYRLERVLGIPQSFWEKYEKLYRDTIHLVNLENDGEVLKKFPFREMQKLQWIKEGKSKEENVIIMRQFFETDNLLRILEDKSLTIACRCLKKTDKTSPAVLAWAQKARIEARTIRVGQINSQRLRDEITHLRVFSLKKFDEFRPILSATLARCGIAIVFLPHLPGAYLPALTFRDGQKIIISLSARGKDADKFWFNLFHEIGHILHGDLDRNGNLTDEEERKADEFSRRTLIPDDKFSEFCNQGLFASTDIKAFAEKISVQPGVVVGRLQKDGYIPFSELNELKEKYKIF